MEHSHGISCESNFGACGSSSRMAVAPATVRANASNRMVKWIRVVRGLGFGETTVGGRSGPYPRKAFMTSSLPSASRGHRGR
jgi:hypothetical protein